MTRMHTYDHHNGLTLFSLEHILGGPFLERHNPPTHYPRPGSRHKAVGAARRQGTAVPHTVDAATAQARVSFATFPALAFVTARRANSSPLFTRTKKVMNEKKGKKKSTVLCHGTKAALCPLPRALGIDQSGHGHTDNMQYKKLIFTSRRAMEAHWRKPTVCEERAAQRALE